MAQHACPANPFQLLMDPEVVLAAVAKSERLAQLRRHLCRPLDRPLLGGVELEGDEPADGGDERGIAAPLTED